MESLKDTSWDVVLSGTGFPQSLLALALSRSGKKVLHVDQNDYYGGAEAALSLQEAESWAETVNIGTSSNLFHNASLSKLQSGSSVTGLSSPRSYSLSLAPQIIYTRSNLLPALVSSKVYRELEFLAVGSWYIYEKVPEKQEVHDGKASHASGDQLAELHKIPGSREDVFADSNLDLRSTRSLMKFLKLAADTGTQAEILSEWGSRPFPDYLTSQFKVPIKLQSQLLALTLSPHFPKDITTEYALPRIHRHLTSIGIFGPGFGAVIPKWGGLAEVAQVGCRAGAVGGGVYVLKRRINRIEAVQPLNAEELDNGEKVQTRWVAGTSDHLPLKPESSPQKETSHVRRSITIVSSPLSELFPAPPEGCPALDGAVVVFPSNLLDDQEVHPPIYLSVHTSGTGECPVGQCVIYAAYTPSAPEPNDQEPTLLSLAIDRFLASIHESPKPAILWNLTYQQTIHNPPLSNPFNENVIQLANVPPSLVLEDEVLRNVRVAWERIVGDDLGNGFMTFEDRQAGEDDGGEEGDE